MGMELHNLACGLSVEHSYCPVSVRRCDITILRSAPNLQETAGLADGTSDRRAACCERVWRLVIPGLTALTLPLPIPRDASRLPLPPPLGSARTSMYWPCARFHDTSDRA